MRYSLVVESPAGKFFAVSAHNSVHACLAEAITLPMEYSPLLNMFPLSYAVYDEVTQQYIKYPSGSRGFLDLN